jgi:hypothetical protein
MINSSTFKLNYKFVAFESIQIVIGTVSDSILLAIVGIIGGSMIAICNGIVFIETTAPMLCLFIFSLPCIAIGRYVRMIFDENEKKNVQ